MLVYGDVEREVLSSDLNSDIAERLRVLASMPPGLDRHSFLVGTFIRAAALVQGVLDAKFHESGRDDVSPFAHSGMEALTTLARALDRSWTSDFTAPLGHELAFARFAHLPETTITTKPAEGYSFYAVYPESYADAARRSGLPSGTRVIGIRSIGASLSAMVAAALGAEPPITVRPVSHPFDRTLALSESLAEKLLEGNPPAYAIVDEGPGMSGSSFGSVADWLEQHGVPRERTHFFPSHINDLGPEAKPEHRERWAQAQRHFVSFETLMLDTGRLQGWTEALLGRLETPLEDISGGQWRAKVTRSETLPTSGWWERRKYLAKAGGERFVIKFEGLGEAGERTLRLARRVYEAGFGPEPIGFVHGLLVQRWVTGVPLGAGSVSRARLLDSLARYLAFRASLRAPADSGASLQRLREMAIYNAGQVLGRDAAERLFDGQSTPEQLEPLVRRVEVDARLHRWEWLVTPEGQLLKADGLDHAHAHDFIGTQDIAWDVVGAIAEHDLTASEIDQVIAGIEADGHTVWRPLLAFLLPCYLAFQLGAWTMSNGADDPMAARYAEKLKALVTSAPAP